MTIPLRAGYPARAGGPGPGHSMRDWLTRPGERGTMATMVLMMGCCRQHLTPA